MSLPRAMLMGVLALVLYPRFSITPVGATANSLAGGILEKLGERVGLRRWLPITVSFNVAAVGIPHLLLQLLWL
ncbi:MAG: hypothetical protein VW450_06670 [Chloroflexota bacterium]